MSDAALRIAAMDGRISFGSWLEKRRKALDLTRQEFAQKAGCSVSTLRKIESDERHPSARLAELMANVLQLGSEERAVFVRVARGDLAIERMSSSSPLPDLSLLQSLQAFSKRIPLPPAPLIGRETEMSALRQMLGDPQCRLITLFGPGGIGKTRLAIETALRQSREDSQGAVFVSLASVRSASLIVQAIGDALGFSFKSSGEPKAQLIDYLREEKLLLVLDNLEHLLEGAGLLAEIIQSAGRVKILCTSREQLNVQGEWVFEVRGLSVSDAEVLFIDCARRAQTDFLAQENDKLTVTRICRLVEGIPLAIELAATWIRILSVSEIQQELQRNQGFLSTSMRALPERHRSMRAVFDHSWGLLTQEEQQALARLTVFRGGFTRDAAEQVAGIDLDVLSALVAKSLVQRSNQNRFGLHELVRQYAARQLETASEVEKIQRRHITFFTDFAEKGEGHFGGPLTGTWLERMEQDNDNLRAALDYAITLQLTPMALQLGGVLWRFWTYRGHIDEGRRLLDTVLVLPAANIEEYALQRAQALSAAGSLARIQGDFAQAHRFHEESLALWRKGGDAKGIAAALNSLGILTMFEGQYATAATYFQESLQLCRQLGIKADIVQRLNNLGVVAMYQGDYQKAHLLHEEAMRMYQELDDRHGTAGSLGNLGDVLRYQGRYERAMQVLEASLTIFQEIGDVHGIVITLASMARAWLAMGDVDRALAMFHTSLLRNQDVGDKTEVANALEGIAEALGAHARQSPAPEDEIRLAVRLIAAANRLRGTVGVPRSAAECAEFDRITAQLRGQLPETNFLTELKRGAEMTTDQTVEMLLLHLSQTSSPPGAG